MNEIYLETELADAGKRLDAYLAEYLENQSRSYIQKLIAQGQVLVSDKAVKQSYRLTGEETIFLRLPDAEALDIAAENIPLSICYEDDSLLVVNKPKGMVVHPAPGHKCGTLVNALLYHAGNSLSGINGVSRPGIVHRIDKDTTGLLLVCKNDKAHEAISRQLHSHRLNRRYVALAEGVFSQKEGCINEPLGRDRHNRLRMGVDPQGKEAITHYQVEEQFAKYALLHCRLETGRTHQIRAHMAWLGHPLAGDILYGGHSLGEPAGQYLHAQLLGFIHPDSGEYMEFSAPLPDYFAERIRKLQREAEAKK